MSNDHNAFDSNEDDLARDKVGRVLGDDDHYESSGDSHELVKDSSHDTAEPLNTDDIEKLADPEDPAIDEAVDDILRTDAIEALPSEANTPTNPEPTLWERMKDANNEWWSDPKKRYGSIGAGVILLAVLFAVPSVRAAFLNTFGVRSKVILKVVDKSTSLPLENVVIELDGQTKKTGESGSVKITGVHIGPQELKIHKLGFGDYKKSFTMTTRIVDFGEIEMKPTGVQVRFELTDYLSGKPIQGAEVSSGESTTKSDNKGRVLLTLEPSQSVNYRSKIVAKGYRTEVLTRSIESKETVRIALVPASPEVFISKKSGKYSVYSIDIDGKNEREILPGTGLENASIELATNESGTHTAVSSTRENKRNKDGYLLSTLSLVDVDKGQSEIIEQAESLQLVGWRGKYLVYIETVAGASAANPNRQKIIAYSVEDNDKVQLASANYFSQSFLAGDTLYYSVASTDGAAKDTFVGIRVDGTARRAYSGEDIWALIRIDYSSVLLQTPNKWMSYTVGATKLDSGAPPPNYDSRVFVDSRDAKRSLWVDSRDSSGVLMLRDVDSGEDKEIASMRGLESAVRWLNDDVVIFRVVTYGEAADYALSLQGGEPKKLAEVSVSNGNRR